MATLSFQDIQAVLEERYDEREARNIFIALTEYVPNHPDAISKVISRIRTGEPWQYIAGFAWFYGMELMVSPAVLIPRQETEELVWYILQEQGQQPLRVLDIGTGSGCIPMALKFNRAHWQVSACDISEEALDLARLNAARCGLHIDFFHADILKELPEGKWDILVSNPPYISRHEESVMPDHVLAFEPPGALFTPTDDPQEFYRRIAALSPLLLENNGFIYLELNEFHARATVDIFREAGYQEVSVIDDLAGRPRILIAQHQA